LANILQILQNGKKYQWGMAVLAQRNKNKLISGGDELVA